MWYERTYAVFNKNYEKNKISKNKKKKRSMLKKIKSLVDFDE